MDHLSKKELLEIVTKQNVDLKRYKSRLTDLVNAHKGLLNEKKLLEDSLKSFNHDNSVTESSSTTSDDNATPTDKVEAAVEGESCEHFKGQIATLMNSLAQLSEEKSRMEATFLSDKKQLRLEKQKSDGRIKELEQRLERETRAHLSEMENFKSKLIVERHQREKEHNDHGMMLRELQKVVSEEREKREKAENAIDHLKAELVSAQGLITRSKADADETKAQLEALEKRLKDSKLKSGDIAVKLQQELEQLKSQHMQTTREEHEKIKEAEEKSKRLAAAHEERVAKLEARLAELSETVGVYDRLRQSDQQAIEKLKERLLQLERELGEEKTDSSSSDLIDKLRTLKQYIEKINSTSEKPIDVKGIFKEMFQDSNFISESHTLCQEEYDQLRNEFDNYKQKYQLSQRSISPSYRSSVSHNKEEELKSQIKKLNERINNLHEQLEGKDIEHMRDLETHKKVMQTQSIQSREQLLDLESNFKKKITNLESQLIKQRERTIRLIDEKDEEIAELRDSLNNLLPSRLSVDKALGEGEGVVLHYSEELARRDVDLARLRREKLQLESELREIKRELAQITSQKQHVSYLLQQQIQRFEQCQTREGANLEYLKNVVLNFLLSNDSNSKSHMLNAITAVLKFTDDEKCQIQQLSWWYKPQS